MDNFSVPSSIQNKVPHSLFRELKLKQRIRRDFLTSDGESPETSGFPRSDDDVNPAMGRHVKDVARRKYSQGTLSPMFASGIGYKPRSLATTAWGAAPSFKGDPRFHAHQFSPAGARDFQKEAHSTTYPHLANCDKDRSSHSSYQSDLHFPLPVRRPISSTQTAQGGGSDTKPCHNKQSMSVSWAVPTLSLHTSQSQSYHQKRPQSQLLRPTSFTMSPAVSGNSTNRVPVQPMRPRVEVEELAGGTAIWHASQCHNDTKWKGMSTLGSTTSESPQIRVPQVFNVGLKESEDEINSPTMSTILSSPGAKLVHVQSPPTMSYKSSTQSPKHCSSTSDNDNSSNMPFQTFAQKLRHDSHSSSVKYNVEGTVGLGNGSAATEDAVARTLEATDVCYNSQMVASPATPMGNYMVSEMSHNSVNIVVPPVMAVQPMKWSCNPVIVYPNVVQSFGPPEGQGPKVGTLSRVTPSQSSILQPIIVQRQHQLIQPTLTLPQSSLRSQSLQNVGLPAPDTPHGVMFEAMESSGTVASTQALANVPSFTALSPRDFETASVQSAVAAAQSENHCALVMGVNVEDKQEDSVLVKSGSNALGLPCSQTMRSVQGDPTLCEICEDRATGLHYGILSCEGCKGFFKRTVQNKKIYTCVGKGQCEVTRIQRNRCQYCRFKKCIQKGMVLGAVREDRMPGGRNADALYNNKRNLQRGKGSVEKIVTEGVSTREMMVGEDWSQVGPCPPGDVQRSAPGRRNTTDGGLVSPTKERDIQPSAMAGSPLNITNLILESNYHPADADSPTSSPQLESIQELLKCECVADIARFAYRVENERNVCRMLSTLGDDIVHHLLQWTQKLPFYETRPIPMNVHLLMLTSRWHEVLFLTTTTYQTFMEPGRKKEVSENGTNTQQDSTGCGTVNMQDYQKELKKNLRRLHSYTRRRLRRNTSLEQMTRDHGDMMAKVTFIIHCFRKLQVSLHEYVCLKVILLLNQAGENQNGELIYSIQEKYTELLEDFVTHTHPNQPDRFGKLMLLLPQIQAASAHLLQSRMIFIPFLLSNLSNQHIPK